MQAAEMRFCAGTNQVAIVARFEADGAPVLEVAFVRMKPARCPSLEMLGGPEA